MNAYHIVWSLTLVVIVLLISFSWVYYDLATIKSIALMGESLTVDELLEPILYVAIARCQVQFFKPLPIFTTSTSHFNTVVITGRGLYIISPRGKILYIIKPKTKYIKHLQLDNRDYIEDDHIVYAVNKFVKVDNKVTLLEFANYEKQFIDNHEYGFFKTNCQHATVETLEHFIPTFHKRTQKGFEYFTKQIQDVVNKDKYLKCSLKNTNYKRINTRYT